MNNKRFLGAASAALMIVIVEPWVNEAFLLRLPLSRPPSGSEPQGAGGRGVVAGATGVRTFSPGLAPWATIFRP